MKRVSDVSQTLTLLTALLLAHVAEMHAADAPKPAAQQTFSAPSVAATVLFLKRSSQP